MKKIAYDCLRSCMYIHSCLPDGGACKRSGAVVVHYALLVPLRYVHRSESCGYALIIQLTSLVLNSIKKSDKGSLVVYATNVSDA